ncbi:hypothetical protein ACVWY5_003873 [Bradyrhizobium sp. USDA 3256]
MGAIVQPKGGSVTGGRLSSDPNNATTLLDRTAQATPTHWSPGPGFSLFYARLLAARRVEPIMFVPGPLI